MKPYAGNVLLTRDQFRETALERDGHRCVICKRTVGPGVLLDVHHVIERRLWTDAGELGGYFLDNAATLCDTGYEQLDGRWSCHLRAGMTLLSPADIRKAAGITKTLLPSGFYADQDYTVWGDAILANGLRTKGPLFDDPSVQAMLKLGQVLHLYTDRVRHPRTYHLPYSPIVLAGNKGDDKVMPDTSGLAGREVVVTAKMDGSQCSVDHDYMHGRTPDFKSDPTWHWMQNFVPMFQHAIDKGWRLNLENLWGSIGTDIQYFHLPQYAMAFMLWDDRNNCLPWDQFVEYVAIYDSYVKEAGDPRGLPTVPVLYRGTYDEATIKGLYRPTLMGDPLEGMVVRIADGFHYRETAKYVGKFVRATHRVRHGGILRRNFLEP